MSKEETEAEKCCKENDWALIKIMPNLTFKEIKKILEWERHWSNEGWNSALEEAINLRQLDNGLHDLYTSSEIKNLLKSLMKVQKEGLK